MIKKKSLLLVGGAGYIGTVITKCFLKKGYRITCLDNLIYNQPTFLNSKKNNYKLILKDLRQTGRLKKILKKEENIVILAGLVGDPITKKYPKLSQSINYEGIKNFIAECKNHRNIKRLIFVSTCSNYGIGKGKKLLDEKSPLKPLSLYSKQKVKIEKYILAQKKINYSPTILRFATAFGISPRMRFDLTVNHFTKSFLEKKTLEVFDLKTARPYCHVLDFARSIDKVLNINKKIVNKEVFNIGSNKNNYTKKQIIYRISRLVKKPKLVFLKGDIDKRDYKVNFNKAKKILNFKPKYSIDHGIREIKHFFKKKKNLKSQHYGNYYIKKIN